MKKINMKIFVMIALFITTGLSYGQTEVDLTGNADPSILKTTLGSAEEGTVILLERGMTYDLTSTAITNSVKIMSKPGDGDPAVLDMGSSSLDITSGSTVATLEISDVEISGNIDGGYLMNFSTEGSIGDFILDNVNIHNLRGVFRAKNSGVKTITNFIIKNSIVDSIGGYGVMVMDNDAAACANVTIEKSTFKNVDRVLRWRAGADAEGVVVSNSTFYNTPMTGDFIRVGNAITNGVEIANTIFGLSNNKLVNGTATVNATNSYKTSDCALDGFAVAPTDYAGASTDLFTDAENGDFTIKDEAFEGLNASGDPRWNALTLKHSYTFEEADTVIDVVGDVDGALEGGATIDEGALVLDADGGYVVFDGTALDLNSYESITMEYFFRGSTTANTGWNWTGYFGDAGGSNNLRTSLGHWNDEIRVVYDASEILLDGRPVNDGNLHHIVTVLTADSLLYYEDGALLGAMATGGEFTIGADYALLGDGYWGDPTWQGEIYGFNIYEGQLSTVAIGENAEDFLAAADASLGGITVSEGTLTPEFSSSVSSYGLLVAAGTATVNVTGTPNNDGATVTGGGDVDVSSGSATVVLEGVSEDGTGTSTTTIFVKVDDACYESMYPELTNIIGDPELTDIANFAGWGNKSIVYGSDAYCGVSSGRIEGTNGGSIDQVLTDVLKLNTTYKLRAAVKVPGTGQCQIGIWGVESSDITFVTSINDEWEIVEGTFTTGDAWTNTDSRGIFFNNYGLSSTDGYIDNWELFETPKKVAYVNENQTMESTNQVDNDPIVQLMSMDPNFEIDVIVIKEDSVVDLSGYDIVVAQETFGSGSGIYTPSGILGLENIEVPFIYNKAYALRDGKAISDDNDPKPAAVDPGFMPALSVSTDNQANALFSGITFDGDSVVLFNEGAADDGSAGSKAMQYVTNLDIVGEGDVALDATMLGLINGIDDATAQVCVNIIPAGTRLGEQDTLKAQMIAISQNYGAICKDGNMTDANLTLWRNAFYVAAGLEAPTDAVDNSIEIEVSAENAMVVQDDDATAIQVTVPMGTTSVDLQVDLIKGQSVTIPTIDGLTDGTTTEYELIVYAVGNASTTYDVAVHVQAEGEILYLSASKGIYATAKKFDTNIYDALVGEGYSVTLLKRGGIFEWTPDGINAFDYTPYAGMVISAGEGSSNVNDFAKRNYPVPCVTMQPDGPRSDKFGWIGVKKDDDTQMNVTKTYDATTAQIQITNIDHPITEGYTVDQIITWTDGTPDSADWSGKEVKSYNLTDSIPDAIALATIPADGSSLTTMWAIPAGSSVRSMNGDYNTYERVTTASNVVFMSLFNDGLLYATDEGMELVLNSLAWAMDAGADFVQSDEGLVEMPAEDYSAYKPGTEAKEGDAWEFGADMEGFMGTGYMQSIMASGDGDQGNAETINAKLTYNVEFTQTGTHYIWAYVYFPDDKSDSFWYGLDGSAAGRIMGSPTGVWKWATGENSFEVSETGMHTFDIMQREPNAIVDHIYVTNDPDFDPNSKSLIFVRTDANNWDSTVVAGIKEYGGYKITEIYQTVITDDLLPQLNAADVVIMGRSLGSSDVKDGKDTWDKITAPVFSMNPWGLRNSRALWYNTGTCSNIVVKADTVLQGDILAEDAVFDGLSGTIDWWNGYFSILAPVDAGNGHTLAQTSDGSPLLTRWAKGVEFYEGSGQIPLGDRSYMGNGNDNTDVVYWGFSDDAKTVFFNELDRLASGEETVIPAKPKKVAYVTADKSLDETASPVAEDPIIKMLEADENIDLTVLVVAADSVLGDLSMYDAVVVQEGFGSGSAILKPGASLGLASIPVPFVYNKMYGLRSGKALTSGDGASLESSSLSFMVDAANQSNDLFKAITFAGDTFQVFRSTYDDSGAEGVKSLNYNTGNVISGDNTLLGAPNGVTDAVFGINDLPAGTIIDSDTTISRMIAVGMNFGAISGNMGTNFTNEGLTFWRNAIYSLVGLEVPAEGVIAPDPALVLPGVYYNIVQKNSGLTIGVGSSDTQPGVVAITNTKDQAYQFIAVDGKDKTYTIQSNAGIYLNKKGENNWTTEFSANMNGLKSEWVLTGVDASSVTLQMNENLIDLGASKSYLSTDATDAGSSLYCDKPVQEAGSNGEFMLQVATIDVAVNRVETASGVMVYPNPASDFAKVAFTLTESANVSLSVYNMLGQKVNASSTSMLNAGSNDMNIETQNLKNGMYIYRLEVDGMTYQGKFNISK